ncbi:MAG: hypothetical protein K0R97_1313 [Oerskovia sp.]|nr:hypothetical protein [Oerskovia sp.]
MLDQLEGREPDTRTQASQDALNMVPRTAAWAESFCKGSRLRPARFARDAAPSIVAAAVQGISEAGSRDADDALYELLSSTIEAARGWAAAEPAEPLEPSDWEPVVRSVGAQV